MEFTSLNQILNFLEDICDNHAQVSSFKFGEVTDISTQQELYPLVWANVADSVISEKTFLLNLSIMVMDIQKSDMSNERDTLSDTLSIAQDIYAALTNPTYEDYFLTPPQVNFEPMREALPDIVNGWKMSIGLELVQLRDRCQIPTR